MRSSTAVARSPESAHAHTLRILVVEDDESLGALLKAVLVELGHACATAKDGFEALAMHRARPFDVVLSDWMMPRMNGLELCRQMRLEPDSAYTYFIFMTGLVDKAHVVEGLEAGADEYIAKPVDIQELTARLVPAARLTALHRRLTDKNAFLLRDSQRSFAVARIDPLTKIGNRLRLEEDGAALTARARRYGHCFCVSICDIDFFKHYNDHFGHLAGDETLRRIVEAMQKSLRQGDTIYRYGGEEFLVLFPELSLSRAAAVMERVRLDVEQLGIRQGASAPARLMTISAGLAELSCAADPPCPVPTGAEGHSLEDCLRRADAALYRAKRGGRNRIMLDVPM